ncbi:hypothetical protein [Sabulicella glaciei]|uniref:Uncharacterized protein n=1 Tax=Sabulicella glaciei TaxID=2984948 RepID=A0ABT3NR63_9PROT|nr:hypothetical protein [Roseococcus sp. MDT2-1-1]MCW8084368.1 hypothetical protein [Roseococcus sp. MDT2-1-1]
MADILRFPARRDHRLRTALRSLDAALADQQAALAQFRAELGSLRQTVMGLQGSVVAYQGGLARLSEDTRGAAREARKLERTAEGWLKA